MMNRLLLAVLLALAVGLVAWLRVPVGPPQTEPQPDQSIEVSERTRAVPGDETDIPPPRPASGRKLLDAKTRFPNIQLYTQDNQPVRFYHDLVKDKIVIINFMYTTCTGT